MSAMAIGRGKVLALAAAAAVAMSMVPVGGAQAAPSACTIDGYTPNKVVMGATALQPTFDVQVSGCEVADWALVTQAFPDVIPEMARPKVTLSPKTLTNADAGKVQAFVVAIGAEDGVDDDPAQIETTFQLQRRSTFGSTFNASPEPVAKGSKITIKATLARINWNGASTLKYIGFPKAKAQLQFRATGASSYTMVKTVTAGTGGKISTTVKASTSGRWRLVFAGLSTTAPATSTSDAVVVN